MHQQQEIEIRGAAAHALRVLQADMPLPGSCGHLDPESPIEILLVGPAGTGKTTGILHGLVQMAEDFPQIRMLVLRAVRKDLNESVLKTLEEDVLPPDHPIRDGRRRDTRDFYEFPNGSRMVLGGLDKPERLYSTEWDVIYIAEAVQVLESQYIPLFRSLRNFRLPNRRRYIICDTNPHAPTHWLHLRAKAGKMLWLRAKHTDNPRYFTRAGQMTGDGRSYVQGTLGPMTGVYAKRLRDGEWAAPAGMVWENWDEARHVIPSERIAPLGERSAKGQIQIVNTYGSIDWGWRDPGCITIGGMDSDKAIYGLEEVYRVCMSIDWWADKALELMRRWKVQLFVADPSRPDHIEHLRRRGVPIRAADNEISFGVDRVRERLAAGRMFIASGFNREPDAVLAAEKKPTGFREEVWGYVYPEAKDGRPIREIPDEACANHACDTWRYLVNLIDRQGFVPEPARYAKGSYGDKMGLAKILPNYHPPGSGG